jgi:hypothetical protein
MFTKSMKLYGFLKQYIMVLYTLVTKRDVLPVEKMPSLYMFAGFHVELLIKTL